LIVDILNYSRLSSHDNQYAMTDLNKVVKELMDDMDLAIAEKRARIEVRDLPLMEVNAGQLRQVFQNLVTNALKFSRPDVPPVIEIFGTTEEMDFPNGKKGVPYGHIHVRDNGIGFDEKYSRSIFNLFEKLHSKDDYEGSGIGLAITKKIVEKHNGYISVNSTENVGTEFIVSLPIHQ
jgi:two-component system CheB/CheR fusion protein